MHFYNCFFPVVFRYNEAVDKLSLTNELKQQAQRLGFALTGVCPAIAAPGYDRFQQWLAAGYAGRMDYLGQREAAYQHPQHVLDGVRSILMLGMSYHTVEPTEPQPGQGRIASYAWGEVDYHDVIHNKLKLLVAWLKEQSPSATTRGVVDTAPLLEREFAQLASIGWIGKNTLLLNRQHGSYFFLAALLTDVELECDEPFAADHCGTCTACLEACPTDAFTQPYVLDATKCISYLTIELREEIPSHLREGVGDWLFGCDVCQQVCPWNSHAVPAASAAFQPLKERNPVDLIPLFELDDAAFRTMFRRTPLWRSKRRGILRNAAVVLGNRPTNDAIAALVKGLNDAEPLVRGACAWALGKYDCDNALQSLNSRREVELDAMVVRELDSALVRSGEL